MSIRSWWKKHVTDPRRRKAFQYLRSGEGGRSTWYHFRAVKAGLLDVRAQVLSGQLLDQWGGICSNAGFLGGNVRRSACHTFLGMAHMFNAEVRGIRKGGLDAFVGWSWPFSDVDTALNDRMLRWAGDSLKVRLACIEWCLEQIEKNGLDRP